MIIEIVTQDSITDAGYIIPVEEEIRRVLITRRGSIPMNPVYGSDLWRYRDRTLDGPTRLAIISEVYDAIERNIQRVVPTRVEITGDSAGRFGLKIYLQRRENVNAA
jgi:phage baseplate assembly protein W